jgi:hypothetical protein
MGPDMTGDSHRGRHSMSRKNARTAWGVLACVLVFAIAASAQSNFSIQNIQQNPDCSITITWPAVPFHSYQVMFANDPGGAWQNFPDGQLTAGTNALTLSYTDIYAPAVPQRFYKVSTPLIPIPLLMMLVLDRSGSMGCAPGPGLDCSGGALYLPTVVTNFINYFNDNTDVVGEDSFSTMATLDVPMQTPFKSAIGDSVYTMTFGGWTYAAGGLQVALNQFNAQVIPPGQKTLRVLVFFTDGFANTALKQLSCSATPLLMSQSDPIGVPPSGPWGYSFENPTNGNGVACNSTTFLSIDGSTKTISYNNQNIWNEGELEALATADTLRQSNIVIFTIGLATSSPPVINTTFLEEAANVNDPGNPTYDPTQPTGAAVFAYSGSQLQAAFQQIASDIQALRLQ